jgi:hypothetical protein
MAHGRQSEKELKPGRSICHFEKDGEGCAKPKIIIKKERRR